MRSVLFVCSANICRSPLAMGLFHLQVDSESFRWCIHSAGVWAENGHPVAQYTQEILMSRGCDVGNYLSQQVTKEMIRDHNLVLTMEKGQKEAMKIAFPEFSSRIYLLSEMVGKIHDIQDPIGQSLVEFERTAKEIDQIFSDGLERIRILAESTHT